MQINKPLLTLPPLLKITSNLGAYLTSACSVFAFPMPPLMALKANAMTPTYLHRSFFTPQTPSLPPIKRYHRLHTHIRLRCRSSLVDEQQKEVVSFSQPENSLIDALIGVQGRGRSVSSQQLSVILLFFRLLFVLFCSVY